MRKLTRRRFQSLLAAGALCGFAGADEARGPRLAVSTWSFHNYFPNTRYGKPEFKLEEWTLEDVVRRAHEKLDIDAFELSSAHLASWDADYLDRLKEYMGRQRCRFVHLSDNVRGLNLAQTDEKKRDEAMDTFKRLIDVARRLDIPTMRVNTGTPAMPATWDLDTTIDCYRRLAAHARERRVEIVLENHFGISADPRNVVRIVEAVKENISACPDFGLFANDEQRWPGLTLMFRHCRRIVSAKFHGLDDKNLHPAFDLERCYRTLREAKFPGWTSLEYEGPLEPMPQLERMAALARQWLRA